MIKIGTSSIWAMKQAFPPERFARDHVNADREYREIRSYMRTYSRKTVWNIFWSANNYAVPHPAPKLDSKIRFWVGTDEWGSRYRDLKWYQKYLPELELEKIPNMAHGEFVMMHPKEFAEKALEFFEG